MAIWWLLVGETRWGTAEVGADLQLCERHIRDGWFHRVQSKSRSWWFSPKPARWWDAMRWTWWRCGKPIPMAGDGWYRWVHTASLGCGWWYCFKWWWTCPKINIRSWPTSWFSRWGCWWYWRCSEQVCGSTWCSLIQLTINCEAGWRTAYWGDNVQSGECHRVGVWHITLGRFHMVWCKSRWGYSPERWYKLARWLYMDKGVWRYVWHQGWSPRWQRWRHTVSLEHGWRWCLKWYWTKLRRSNMGSWFTHWLSRRGPWWYCWCSGWWWNWRRYWCTWWGQWGWFI